MSIIALSICIGIFASNTEASEQDYTDVFCATVDGNTKHVFDDRTRPDCIDDTFVYEMDWATGSKVYEGIGQALHYATQSDKVPALVLIMKQPTDIRFVLRAININVCPKIHIWTIDPDHNIIKRN